MRHAPFWDLRELTHNTARSASISILKIFSVKKILSLFEGTFAIVGIKIKKAELAAVVNALNVRANMFDDSRAILKATLDELYTSTSQQRSNCADFIAPPSIPTIYR